MKWAVCIRALHHSLQASSTHVNWLGSYVVSYTATMHTALLFTTACIIQCISKIIFSQNACLQSLFSDLHTLLCGDQTDTIMCVNIDQI